MKIGFVSAAAAAAFLLWAAPAIAQVPQPVLQQAPVYGSFYKTGRSTDLSATVSSASQALPATGGTSAYVCNIGSNLGYVEVGTSTVAATVAGSFPVIAGQCVTLYATGLTHVAAITPTSTTTLTVALGWGTPFPGGGGSGSGGGGGGTSSSFSASFPSTGTAVGMSQGGNMVPLTGTSNNLNVQCANCSGSGVSTADQATFTAGSSLFAGAGGFFQTTATSNPLTTGQQGLFQVTAQRALFANLRNASGAELGIAAAPLQVSLANTGANATAILTTGTGGTFPVTQATAASLNATVVGTGTFAVQAAQSGTWNVGTVTTVTAVTSITNPITVSTHAITIASSGVASGAFASGAYASGSVSSGAFASGSLAAGSMVDLLTMRQTVAAGTVASNSLLAGGIYNSSPITMTNGQGAALQFDANGYLKVNTAAGAAAGGTSSNFGSAFPTPGTAIGTSDGTNMVALRSTGNAAWVGGNVAAAASDTGNPVKIGGKYSAAVVTALTDGQRGDAQLDSASNLKVSHGLVTNTLSGWTSATSLNATQTLIANHGAPAIVVQLNQTSTIAAGAVTFEGTYDGTNWVTVPVSQFVQPATFAPLTNPYTLVASTNQPFTILTQGFQSLRIKLSTQITGSATVTPFVVFLNDNPVINSLLNPASNCTATTCKVNVDQTTPQTTNLVAAAGLFNVTPTSCGGTIASGGTAQNAITAGASLRGFTIANTDTTEVMWISFTGTAVAGGSGSFPLAPATATSFAGLSSYTTPFGAGFNTNLSVIGATTSHPFSCTKW